ncbi:MAG: hypothetical protein KAI47_21285, partial [Deltaproteobacteria bacterium]|nr:hypothetical protein [Deltaproteobacteria bacterium]
MIALDPPQPRDASTPRAVPCFQTRPPSRRVGARRLMALLVLVASIAGGGCRWIAGYKPGTSARRDAADDALAKDDISSFRDAPPTDQRRDSLADIVGTYDSGALVCVFPKEQPTNAPIIHLWIGADGHRYAATGSQVFEQSPSNKAWTELSGLSAANSPITGLTGNADWIVAITQGGNIQAWRRNENLTLSAAFGEFHPIGVAIHKDIIYAATKDELHQIILSPAGFVGELDDVEGITKLAKDETFQTIWSDGDRVWLAGGSSTAGAIRVYDPDPSATQPWESFPRGVTSWVAGWGANRSNVIIAPNSALHYTPGNWFPRTFSTSNTAPNAVWGRSAGDIFVVGNAGGFWPYRSNGSWNAVTDPNVPDLTKSNLIAAYGHDHTLLIAV